MGNLSGVEITTLKKAREHCLTNISLKQTFPAQTVKVLFWFTTPEMIILEKSTEPGSEDNIYQSMIKVTITQLLVKK